MHFFVSYSANPKAAPGPEILSNRETRCSPAHIGLLTYKYIMWCPEFFLLLPMVCSGACPAFKLKLAPLCWNLGYNMYQTALCLSILWKIENSEDSMFSVPSLHVNYPPKWQQQYQWAPSSILQHYYSMKNRLPICCHFCIHLKYLVDLKMEEIGCYMKN